MISDFAVTIPEITILVEWPLINPALGGVSRLSLS